MSRRAALAAAMLVAGWLAPAAALTPAEVENPRTARGSWVTDAAGVLGSDAEASIDAIVEELRRTTTAEIAVVTVPGTGDREPRAFATELFNLWRIGAAGTDNGVLVLIVTGARRIEVETGYGAEAALPDGRVGGILDTYVVPRYREGDWDGGTVAGVRQFAAALAPRVAGGDGAGAFTYSPAPARGPGPPVAVGAALAALVASLATVVWARSRPRRCARCRRAMRLLTRAQEGAYLSDDERFEERLRSVDHRVWRCDDCQQLDIEHRRRWFSGHGECPACHRRTLATRRHTLVAATYESAGLMRVDRQCQLARCGHRDTSRETIPQLTRSSSGSGSGGSGGGSGGSFGGGRSGGGGAGRSW